MKTLPALLLTVVSLCCVCCAGHNASGDSAPLASATFSAPALSPGVPPTRQQLFVHLCTNIFDRLNLTAWNVAVQPAHWYPGLPSPVWYPQLWVTNYWELYQYTNYHGRGQFGHTNLVRNPKFWLANVENLNCYAASFVYSYPWQTVILAISPRHVIMTAHAGKGVGTKVNWLGTNNVLYQRTISAVTNLSPLADISIGLLDSSLPPAVRPALFLPESFLPLASLVTNCYPPMLHINQDRLVRPFAGVIGDTNYAFLKPGMALITTNGGRLAVPPVRGSDSAIASGILVRNQFVVTAADHARSYITSSIAGMNAAHRVTNTIQYVNLNGL